MTGGNSQVPTEAERNNAFVKQLLDEIAAKDEMIRGLNRWIVALVCACFVLLCLAGGSTSNDPDWTGVTHADSR